MSVPSLFTRFLCPPLRLWFSLSQLLEIECLHVCLVWLSLLALLPSRSSDDRWILPSSVEGEARRRSEISGHHLERTRTLLTRACCSRCSRHIPHLASRNNHLPCRSPPCRPHHPSSAPRFPALARPAVLPLAWGSPSRCPPAQSLSGTKGHPLRVPPSLPSTLRPRWAAPGCHKNSHLSSLSLVSVYKARAAAARAAPPTAGVEASARSMAAPATRPAPALSSALSPLPANMG